MTENVAAPQLFSRASDFNINGGVFNSYVSPPAVQSVVFSAAQSPSTPMVARHTEEDSENLNEIEVYVRLLLRRRRGYPLWIPKPGDWLPLAYRQEGVRIGDVGILTEFGGFDYLFNVCLPADHPVNAGRVPEQFRQLQGIDIGDMTWSTEEYMPGSYVASNPSHFSQTKIEDSCANVPGVPEEVGVGMSFSSSATKGALLIVPEGGKRIDHQQYSKFYKYAAECARSWYTHVNGPLMARGVHNGALYLVTGCDKARAWGVSSFIDAHPGSVSLEFVPRKASYEGGLPEYVFRRCNYASSSSGADNVFGNQSGCMFLRGLKIAVRLPRIFPKIRAQVKYISDLDTEDLLPGKQRTSFPFSVGKQLDYFRLPRIGSNSGAHDPMDIDSEMDIDVPSRYQVYHPSDVINRWILSNFTGVEVAITHDDDWASVILDDEEQIPDDNELIARISNFLTLDDSVSGHIYAHFNKHKRTPSELTTTDDTKNPVPETLPSPSLAETEANPHFSDSSLTMSHGSINGVKISPIDDSSKVVKVIASDCKTGDRREISYSNCKVIGNGSSGVVFQAKLVPAPKEGEDIAIKQVLQDKRFKNRELQIMRLVTHPNVVDLRAFFYTNGEKKDEVYLNLMLEYVPETVYRANGRYTKLKQHMPMLQIKLYMYQLLRSLAYIHSVGICHRDIKPQNLLLNPATGVLKLCDFGSAKILVAGEPNISYICSRYYRAPELIFGATNYTTNIDIWSTGCVMAELMLGQPLFPGESGIDQLVEIIKILGTPSREQIKTMNPNYMEHKFPQIKPHPFSKVFRPRTPPEAIDLVSKLLEYTPGVRLSSVEAMVHPFFDELRVEGTRMPSGKGFPPLFNFTCEELSVRPDLMRRLVPPHCEPELASRNIMLENFVPIPLESMKITLD